MSDKREVKAWALVDKSGRLIDLGGYVSAFKKKSDATYFKEFGERVVRVTVRIE